jgi:hypothetical protein
MIFSLFFHSHSKQVYQMLKSFTEIQRIAYQTAANRNRKDMLILHLRTFAFAVGYRHIFRKPKKVGLRRVFGCPYHSIVKHFPETYRCISQRSLVAEAAERTFRELRESASASNNSNENMLRSITTRNHFALRSHLQRQTVNFLKSQKQVSAVSEAAGHFGQRRRLTWTAQFIKNLVRCKFYIQQCNLM